MQVYRLAAAVIQAAGWAAGRQMAPTFIQAARLELYGHSSGSVPANAHAGTKHVIVRFLFCIVFLERKQACC